jgi:hypothetical protein
MKNLIKDSQIENFDNPVPIDESSSDPVNNLDNYGLLYTKSVIGNTELHFADRYGTIYQLTSGGYLNVSPGVVDGSSFIWDGYNNRLWSGHIDNFDDGVLAPEWQYVNVNPLNSITEHADGYLKIEHGALTGQHDYIFLSIPDYIPNASVYFFKAFIDVTDTADQHIVVCLQDGTSGVYAGFAAKRDGFFTANAHVGSIYPTSTISTVAYAGSNFDFWVYCVITRGIISTFYNFTNDADNPPKEGEWLNAQVQNVGAARNFSFRRFTITSTGNNAFTATIKNLSIGVF